MPWIFLSRRIKTEREKIQVFINITTFHKHESLKNHKYESSKAQTQNVLKGKYRHTEIHSWGTFIWGARGGLAGGAAKNI